MLFRHTKESSEKQQFLRQCFFTRWEWAFKTQRNPQPLKTNFQCTFGHKVGTGPYNTKETSQKTISQGTHLFRMREQPFKTQRNPLKNNFSGHMFVQNVGTGL